MDNRSAKIKSDFGKIIKEEIGHILEENDCAEILDDDDMRRLGAQLPPEDMHDRIMKACKDDKPVRKHNVKRIFIIAAIVATFAGGTGAMAYRFFGTNLFAQMSKHSVRIAEAGEEEIIEGSYKNAIKTAKESFGDELVIPDYIPKGFYIDEINIEPEDTVEIIYLNSNKDKVKITQEIKTSNFYTANLIDSSASETSVEKVGKYEVVIAEYLQDETEIKWIKALWNDEKLRYSITSNIQKDEILRIIEEM